MPREPYPSQMAPKPSKPKRPKKPAGSMDKDLRQFAKPMPKRIGKTMMKKDMIKKPAYGMSSTPEQRKMARMQMTNDMKKRGMLRKKQG